MEVATAFGIPAVLCLRLIENAVIYARWYAATTTNAGFFLKLVSTRGIELCFLYWSHSVLYVFFFFLHLFVLRFVVGDGCYLGGFKSFRDLHKDNSPNHGNDTNESNKTMKLI